MQLTPEVLPVLSSKRLFVHSDLSAVSPAVHPTLKALRTELKVTIILIHLCILSSH
jgi:hypothetical protein